MKLLYVLTVAAVVGLVAPKGALADWQPKKLGDNPAPAIDLTEAKKKDVKIEKAEVVEAKNKGKVQAKDWVEKGEKDIKFTQTCGRTYYYPGWYSNWGVVPYYGYQASWYYSYTWTTNYYVGYYYWPPVCYNTYQPWPGYQAYL